MKSVALLLWKHACSRHERTWEPLVQRVPRVPELVERSRAHVLDEDVASLQESLEHSPVLLGVLDVEANGVFAAVH